MAQYLYRAGVRTQVLIFIYGLQGAGKSWFTDLLGALMGATAYAETNDPDNHLFAKHSGMWLGRIVVHIEEAKRLRAVHDKLKNIVTMVRLSYEEKYQPQKTATNFTNIIITTNISNAVYVPFDDRRICNCYQGLF
jgi:phage/plasmid-associated DNA primase